MDRTPIIEIRVPIWYGGNRCIGINTNRVTDSQLYKIQITHKRVDGTRTYPNDFYMRGRDIKKYEAKELKKYPGTWLHWVPVKDLSIEKPGSDICIEHNHIKTKWGECPMEIEV